MIPRAQKYGYDYFDEISLLGDLNNDSLINILDVILYKYCFRVRI